jgi:hypothetical protein
VPVRRLLLFCCLEHLLEPELETAKPKQRRWALKRTDA